jgi:magnesium-dependent phosphatase 1
MSGDRNYAVMPELAVFDLDECLWSPEMYTLSDIPNESCKILGPLPNNVGEGVIGVRSGREVVKIFPDALVILQDIYLGKYPSLRIAAASSADTPHAVKIGRASMSLLEILPGVTMRQVFAKGWDTNFDGNVQIGRSPPLSSDKGSSHFPIIQRETGIPYTKMIFFDDCNWGDNCARVASKCPGVVTQKTPDGLHRHEWHACLDSYEKRYAK